MFRALFGVGLLSTAAGIVTIGFGIPINASSLGNMLILSGTAAAVGGFILIGLAVQIGQLNRLTIVLARLAEVIKSQSVAGVAETEFAETHSTARSPEPLARAATQSHAPAATEKPSLPDWLRSKAKTTSKVPLIAPEPAVVRGPDNAPLSPRAPQRAAISPPPYSTWPDGAQPNEPKLWLSRRDGGAHEVSKGLEAEMLVAPSRAEDVARITPAMEKDVTHKNAAKSVAKEMAGLFNNVWPDTRPKSLLVAAPAAREAGSEFPSASKTPQENHHQIAPESPKEILKSGVICGMAYTFYADGSIEAELAQGIVTFASIEALRAHLQKSN